MLGSGTDDKITGCAYGFRFEVPPTRLLQPEGAEGRPPVVVRRSGLENGRERLSGRVVELPLVGGGVVMIEEKPPTVTFVPGDFSDDELVHPYLAPAASVLASWRGWMAFHAGAVVVAGRALAILGRREDGKSTLLAAMAAAGYTVLTDDVLVLEDGWAHVGPRCVELRRSGVDPATFETPLEPSRSGERSRLLLPPADPAPLAGWVSLEWGEPLGLAQLNASQRLDRLARARSRVVGANDAKLLEFVDLPGWVLRRPRDVELLSDTVELVGGALA